MTFCFREALVYKQKALGSRTINQIWWPKDVIALLGHDVK